jgi:hypothetical protein
LKHIALHAWGELLQLRHAATEANNCWVLQFWQLWWFVLSLSVTLGCASVCRHKGVHQGSDSLLATAGLWIAC